MGGSRGEAESPPLTGFVALMRGINVGGANKLPMTDLRALFEFCDAKSVATYIQSGNVVFLAPRGDGARIAAAVGSRVAEKFGFAAPVVIVEAPRLPAILGGNPFLARGEDPAKLHIAFLSAPADAARLAKLAPRRSPPDEFFAAERCVYLFLPNGVARSKLTNAWLDATLGVTSTLRNLTTATKLLQMVDALR